MTAPCPSCWTASASQPVLVPGGPGPALHAAVAAGEALALGSAPRGGLIARPLTPTRRVRFALIWRDETPSPALRELITRRGSGRRDAVPARAGGGGMTRDRLLTAADEVRLARRIERGDLAAKDELVTANLRLVHAVAQRYRGFGVPLDDLVQEGSIGLIRAAEKFDHRRGLKFSTYAVWWIRRSIMDAVTNAQVDPHPARRSAAARGGPARRR